MRFPQVIIQEPDGKLGALVRDLARQQRWTLREPRSPEACLRLLGPGGPAVLVLKVGRELGPEIRLLERATRLFPDTPVVVVGDADNAPLAGLAWDLGAAVVVAPPLPRDELPEIVAGLMEAAMKIADCKS